MNVIWKDRQEGRQPDGQAATGIERLRESLYFFSCSRHIHSCQQQKTCTLDQRQTKKMLVYFRNPTLSSANFHNVLWQNRNKKCFSSEMICCFIKIFHNMQNIPQSWFPKINTFSCQAREGTHFPWMKMQELQRK